MPKSNCKISKYASILYRTHHIYFDEALRPFDIGGGQQFFLLRIYESPGISLLELAQTGNYDKGTTARAVQKLSDRGYIRCETDSLDKRLHRLYPTEHAVAAVNATYHAINQWHEILTAGFTAEETSEAEALMGRMAEQAHTYIVKRKNKKEQ